MPSSGAPTTELTTDVAEPQGAPAPPSGSGGRAGIRPAAGLVDQRYAPALGLAAKIGRARDNLRSCREHLRSATSRTEPVRRLLGELDSLIALSERIIALDQELGGSLAAIAHNRRAQVVNALGDLAEKVEEIRSAEDVTIVEIVADALSFGLNRIGDYSYVLSARSAARGDLEKLRPRMEQELVRLLEQRTPGQDASVARNFCDAVFDPRRRAEQLGPMALLVLAAIFRSRCALFVERLDDLVQEKHSGSGN